MKQVKLSIPGVRTLYGRPMAVATLIIDGKPEGEFPLAQLLARQRNGEFVIENPGEVLAHLVLHLGVGA